MIYLMKRRGKVKSEVTYTFLDSTLYFETIDDALINYETVLEKIPQEQRYNIFLRMGHFHHGSIKKFISQDVIAFDIDGVDLKRKAEYFRPICDQLQLDPGDVGWITTGNGFHIIIGLTYVIQGTEFFTENRNHYTEICSKINNALKKLKLPGHADPEYFKYSNTIRFPGTKNIKTTETGYNDKNLIKDVVIDQRFLNRKEWWLDQISGIETLDQTEIMTDEQYARLGTVDAQAVLNQCEFLISCKADPESVTEGNWFKMLTILGRLPDSQKLAHEYSQGHPGYEPEETDYKLQRAVTTAKARSCKNIGQSFDCRKCRHFASLTVNHPLKIKGEDFVATQSTGFRKINMETMKPGAIEYDDLLKFFLKKHRCVSNESGVVYKYTGTHWEYLPDLYIEQFAEDNVIPAPRNGERVEFLSKVRLHKIVNEEAFFLKTSFRKMNFRNGVLDLSKPAPELLPHDPKYGFLSVLPYDYDPNAECERFDRFLKEVTLERQELEDVLLEFAGYSFANMDCTLAKALILLGEGANGKSTFMELLQKMAGKPSYCSVPLSKLGTDQYSVLLHGKLFNLTEETPGKAFSDSSVFKNLVSGGDYSGKILFKNPITLTNRAKFITACNEMPKTSDTSKGMMRRLLIVPFDATFEKDAEDIHIKDKLEAELSGIFNRVIEGYYRLSKNKKFTTSEVIKKQKEEYTMHNDPVAMFHEEYIEEAKFVTEKLKVIEVYNMFREYCTSIGVPLYAVPNLISFSLNRVFKKYPRTKDMHNRYFTHIKLKSQGSDF